MLIATVTQQYGAETVLPTQVECCQPSRMSLERLRDFPSDLVKEKKGRVGKKKKNKIVKHNIITKLLAMSAQHYCGTNYYSGAWNYTGNCLQIHVHSSTYIILLFTLSKLLSSTSNMFSILDVHLYPSGSLKHKLWLGHAPGDSDQISLDGVWTFIFLIVPWIFLKCSQD